MTSAPKQAPAYESGLRLIQGSVGPRPRTLSWILFVTIAVVIFFALIYGRTSLDRSAFELSEIERAIALENARFEQLKLEVARLSSPNRIAPLAESMGMALPDDVERLVASGVERFETDREERWAEMKSVLTASP